MKYLLMGLIRLYQWTISPLLGPVCRFYPSCSHYGYEAMSRHGAAKGTALTVWRLLRCNPWNAGGYDPVPPRGRWRSVDESAEDGTRDGERSDDEQQKKEAHEGDSAAQPHDPAATAGRETVAACDGATRADCGTPHARRAAGVMHRTSHLRYWVRRRGSISRRGPASVRRPTSSVPPTPAQGA